MNKKGITVKTKFGKNIEKININRFKKFETSKEKNFSYSMHSNDEFLSDKGISRVYFMGGISFKGNDAGEEKINNAEFEKRKKSVHEMINNSPMGIREKFNSINYNEYNIPVAEKLLSHPELLENKDIEEKLRLITGNTNSEEKARSRCFVMDKILNSPQLSENKNLINKLGGIILFADSKHKVHAAEKFLDNPVLLSNDSITDGLETIIRYTNSEDKSAAICAVADHILSNPHLLNNNISDKLGDIIKSVNSGYGAKVAQKLLDNPGLLEVKKISDNLKAIIYCTDSKENAEAKCQIIEEIMKDGLYKNENTLRFLEKIIQDESAAKYTDNMHRFINKAKNNPNLNSLTYKEFILGIRLEGLFNVKTAEEIPVGNKKNILNELISCGSDLFNTSEEFKNIFPLMPKNQEEYCELLSALTDAVCSKTQELNEAEKNEFYGSLTSLAATLGELGNDEFNQLEISQTYPKEDFIKNTIEIISELDNTERHQIYKLFDFELRKNNHTESGYTIIGYPKNNNKEEQPGNIKKEETGIIVKKLKEEVDKFTKNNEIKAAGNIRIEQELNQIVKTFPELRTMIGKVQHKTHDFDLMKHSLKVIQGIVKNNNYDKLNDSDKKIIILAALFHDIAKSEGEIDKKHAQESAHDASVLTERLGLNQNERFKLYNLISNHEWLEYANKDDNIQDIKKRLMDIAYDFRFYNSFDMAMMLTLADLAAVKKNNNDGNIFSDIFTNKALDFEPQIKTNIEKLKKTQPLLPVTKIPKASEISKAIKEINDDGSTNIKGVYKNKNGVIIIKFNETENWEEIGFPKGTISRGIRTKTSNDNEINTGNIHFFIHGLNTPGQLIKFDTFALQNSEVLLSVSYAESPESKHEFFRPQGVILDCDTKNIHGGGSTDTGSGEGKYIQTFKDKYISEDKEGYNDRVYISELIKKRLGINDSEYVQFIKENENKSFTEIEPEYKRNEIIRAFTEINSNKNKGERKHSEFFISNPYPPMAVFAYAVNTDKEAENPVDFLDKTEKRTRFLQDYALERDIPFIIFGN